MIMSVDNPTPGQHPGPALAAMMLTNAMVLVDQTAVPLTLAEIMRNYDIGSQKVQWVLNDPVSLSDVPEASHGQVAGVSATAEQFGGALGIAVLYLIFHAAYVTQLHAIINRGPLADLSQDEYARLRADIIAAESIGLKPKVFDPLVSPYLHAAGTAAAWGYAAAFAGITLLGIGGSALAWRTGTTRAAQAQTKRSRQ
jgi:hypothetical protein